MVRLLHITTVPMSLTFLRGQVDYMRERGLDIRALCSPGADLDRFAAELNLPVEAVHMTRRITPLRDVRAVLRIVTVLRRLRPAIVHAHTPKGGLLGMIAATIARVPVRVYHMRGLPLTAATGIKRVLLRWAEMTACRLAHRVICVSHSLRHVAVDEGLCNPEKMHVMGAGSGQGVDARGRFDLARLADDERRRTRERLGIPQDAFVAGFVGRIVRDKGVVELAAAWATLREDYPHLHMLLVGPFEPQDPVPADTESALRDDARVQLVGMEWDTPPLYAAMDLLVLPSYREGFPNTPLEAAAMELPVIATLVPGCMDAVEDSVTGTLVPARDAAALAEAVRCYLDDVDLGRSHGRAGRERVLAEFRPEMIWEMIYMQYVQLMAEKGIAVPTAAAVGAP